MRILNIALLIICYTDWYSQLAFHYRKITFKYFLCLYSDVNKSHFHSWFCGKGPKRILWELFTKWSINVILFSHIDSRYSGISHVWNADINAHIHTPISIRLRKMYLFTFKYLYWYLFLCLLVMWYYNGSFGLSGIEVECSVCQKLKIIKFCQHFRYPWLRILRRTFLHPRSTQCTGIFN